MNRRRKYDIEDRHERHNMVRIVGPNGSARETGSGQVAVPFKLKPAALKLWAAEFLLETKGSPAPFALAVTVKGDTLTMDCAEGRIEEAFGIVKEWVSATNEVYLTAWQAFDAEQAEAANIRDERHHRLGEINTRVENLDFD